VNDVEVVSNDNEGVTEKRSILRPCIIEDIVLDFFSFALVCRHGACACVRHVVDIHRAIPVITITVVATIVVVVVAVVVFIARGLLVFVIVGPHYFEMYDNAMR